MAVDTLGPHAEDGSASGWDIPGAVPCEEAVNLRGASTAPDHVATSNPRSADLGREPSSADVMALVQIERFAERVERRLRLLSSLVEQAAAGLTELRQECAAPSRAIRAVHVVACPGPVKLTTHEAVVLRLAAEGHGTAQIAIALGVGPATVKSQLRAAFRKLGVHSRAAAARHLLGYPPNGGNPASRDEFPPFGG